MSLLVAAALPIGLPTAMATHSVQINSISIEYSDDNVNWQPLTPTQGLVKNNTWVRFNVQATVGGCENESTNGVTTYRNTATVTVETGGVLHPSSSDLVGSLTIDGVTASGTIGPVLARTFDASPVPTTQLDATLTHTCNTGAALESDDEGTSPLYTTSGFAIDLRAPTFVSGHGFPSITNASTNVPRSTGTDATTGATVTIALPTTSDTTASLSYDASRFTGDAVGFQPLNGATTFAIQAPDLTVPSLNNTLVPLILRTTDSAGNHRDVTHRIRVDNVGPTQAISGETVTLTRLPGSTALGVRIDWTGGGSPLAQFFIDGQNHGVVSSGQPVSVPLPAGDTPEIRLRPVDANGNVGTTLETIKTGYARIVSAPYLVPNPGAAPVPKQGVGDLSITVENTTGTARDFTATLGRLGHGFWNGGNPQEAASYIATPTPFRVAGPTLPNTFTLTNFTGKDFPDGIYRISYTINSTSGVRTTHYGHFAVDSQAPDLKAPSLGITSLQVRNGLDANAFEVFVHYNETRQGDSKLKDMTFELVDAQRNVVTNLTGQPARVKVTFDKADAYLGSFTGTFPNLTVGDYRLRVLANDTAGNEHAHLFSGANELFKVRPRVFIANSPVPELTPDGLVVSGLAAWECNFSPRSNITRDAGTNLCSTDSMTIYGRNIDSDWIELQRYTLPQPTMRPKGGVDYFVYESNTPISTRTLSTTRAIEVKAVTNLFLNGVNYVVESTPERVKVPDAPALIINRPNLTKDVAEWMINTTGTVRYNATFEFKNTADAPNLQYELALWNGNAWAVQQTAAAQRDPSSSSGEYLFNYTGVLGPLDNGEYRFTVTATDTSDASIVHDKQVRHFAVQKDAPIIGYKPTVGKGLVPDQTLANTYQVAPTFDISVEVNHGVANVTDVSAFDYRLRRAQIAPGEAEILAPNEGGFTVAVKDVSSLSPLNSWTFLNLTVTLPTSAKHGDRFILNVSTTTDAKDTPGTPYEKYTGIGLATVQLDTRAPDASVWRLDTNNTGLDLGTPLRVLGDVADAGAGLKKIEVKLRNLTSDKTFVWNATSGGFGDMRGGSFQPGDVDSWMSNEIVYVDFGAYLENVNLTPLSGGRIAWTLHADDDYRLKRNATGAPIGGTFDAIPLDRASTYEVTVRATDKLGNVATTPPRTVRFDPQPPQILSQDAPGWVYTHNTTFPWHGQPHNANPVDVLFSARVQDNHCVGSVELVALAPSGATLRAPFPRPANATCTATTGDSETNWTINLRHHTHMINEIGEHSYWVEVKDPAGQTTATPAADRDLKVFVTDTFPARVHSQTFRPFVAQLGSFSELVFKIDENQKLDDFRVTVSTVSPTGRVNEIKALDFANPAAYLDASQPSHANGTGTYILNTMDHLGLDLEIGKYLFEIQARDVERVGCWNTPQIVCEQKERIILNVEDGGVASILMDAPSANAAYLNATPDFSFRVLHPNVTASHVVLRVGDAEDNLSAVTPTITPMTSSTTGAATGVRVNYTADLAGYENVTVELRASTPAGVPTVFNATFVVDAVAPTVDLEVLDNMTGPDGRDYVVPATRINITASDALSGVASVTVLESSNNETPVSRVVTAGEPFQPQGEDGFYRLQYVVRDAAGNQETGTFEAYMDQTGPSITLSSETNGLEIFVTAADRTGTRAGVGLDASSLELYYRYLDESDYTNVSLTPVTGNLYKAALPRNASELGMEYYVEALDLLGNRGTLGTLDAPQLIEAADEGGEGPGDTNTEPVLTITSPSDGTTVSGDSLRVEYEATDADADALTITVALRSGSGSEVLMPAGENTGVYLFDATGLAAGDYTLVVTAHDGSASGQDEVSFRIPGSTPDVPPMRVVSAPPANITAGSMVNFTVDLSGSGKSVLRATFTVMRDGQVVASDNLVRLANGYRGSYTPTAAGSYQVLVSAQFADGTSLEATPAGSFSVADAGTEPVPTGGSFPASLILLLVMGALTVGLAAYAAFVRWK